jgi:hypothetical protein
MMTKHGGGFGGVSARERREADLFYADLMGRRTSIAAVDRGRARSETLAEVATATAWTPLRADEIDTASNTDKFAAQTFETTIPLRTDAGRIDTPVSIFMPRLGRSANFIQVHVFFSPGTATQAGLTTRPAATSTAGFNAVMMHGLRGSTDASGWIMIGVPGREPGFVAMDAADIATCLGEINPGSRYQASDIGAVRLSAHSRGYRGLKATVAAGTIPVAKIDRVVIFDAVYASLNAALGAARIPGSKQFAYQVNVGTRLSATGATNIALDAAAMRAIGYSRLIADTSAAARVIGATVPAFTGSTLTLPPRGTFTTRAGAPATMTNINAFAAANRTAIRSIVSGELAAGGAKTYIDANNLTRLFQPTRPFDAAILSHHLFVAELAHEIVD